MTQPKKKRYPLPKRFNIALSERAYDNLRALNAQYGLGNNYLLTVLLENLDSHSDPEKRGACFKSFVDEFGAPTSQMKKN